jgi:hypothetical protein
MTNALIDFALLRNDDFEFLGAFIQKFKDLIETLSIYEVLPNEKNLRIAFLAHLTGTWPDWAAR